MLGRLLEGKYRVTRLIGEGGMGVVYEAEHTLIGRPVALKLLHGDFARNPDALERFHREARAATAIRHPNIIEITDMGTTPEGQPFLVLELLDGVPLARLLRDAAPLPAARLRDIVVQVLEALEAAHAKGIIHRDLKPDNVFVIQHPNRPDFVKLLDFGVSKLTGEALGEGISTTRTGTLMGTPSYMSPEQARGRKDIDHRVDLWACGVMIYEASCGRLPYLGDNYNELLSSILLEDPPPPRQLNPRIPAPLERFLERALAKDRDLRFPSAAEMRAAFLDATATGPEATDGPPARAPATSATTRAPGPAPDDDVPADRAPTLLSATPAPDAVVPATRPLDHRRRQRLAALVTAAAAALALVVALVVTRSGGPERTDPAGPLDTRGPAREPPAPEPTEPRPAPARDNADAVARPDAGTPAAPADATEATDTTDATDTTAPPDAARTPPTTTPDATRRPAPARDAAAEQLPPAAPPACGNGRCESGENCDSCPDDCGVAELCDGIDNDCDTEIDEDFGVGRPCDGPDHDSCATGSIVCDGPAESRCDEESDGLVETCNGLDDDCDNEIDEDFDLLLDALHCGRCDHACPPETPACCVGECVDTRGDERHCGACGRSCAAPEEGCCAGTCADLRQDPHCGACGKDCAADGLCCGPVDPPAGYGCVDC